MKLRLSKLYDNNINVEEQQATKKPSENWKEVEKVI